jgi:L-alanine-DL-glutamate epimerase-like enolase superfamily enzyme
MEASDWPIPRTSLTCADLAPPASRCPVRSGGPGHQWFLKTPLTPVNGVVRLQDTPGLGMDLDESKIEEQRPLSWTETRWS